MQIIFSQIFETCNELSLNKKNELDWEREELAPGTADPEPTPYEQILYDEDPYTENIFESEEDEIPYDLPDKVPPEKIDKQAE